MASSSPWNDEISVEGQEADHVRPAECIHTQFQTGPATYNLPGSHY